MSMCCMLARELSILYCCLSDSVVLSCRIVRNSFCCKFHTQLSCFLFPSAEHISSLPISCCFFFVGIARRPYYCRCRCIAMLYLPRRIAVCLLPIHCHAVLLPPPFCCRCCFVGIAAPYWSCIAIPYLTCRIVARLLQMHCYAVLLPPPVCCNIT